MITKSANGYPLLISDIDDVEKELNSSYVPCVVLLTAWNTESASTEFWRDLVFFLLSRGAYYFVCAGKYTEQLHDGIDDLIEEYDYNRNTEIAINTVTTFHPNESIEEVVNFYLYAIDIRENSAGCLLAILNDDVAEDRKMKESLLRNCEGYENT